MWRRLTTTLVDIQQQPVIFPEMVSAPKMALSAFTFRNRELEAFEWLTSVSPCYPVNPNKIRIIAEPEVFYNTVKRKCETARKRIVLSSLYLGTGSLEKNLVSAINANEHYCSGSLTINVLLDYQRGSRGIVNSRTMLLPLLQNTKQNCQVSLYHSPHLRGVYKSLLPQRWNEIIELQHMKVYLMDDTVIISGANLSNDYFTNRQDRYIMIEDKALADFYANLVSRVQSFSFQLQKDGSVRMAEGSPHPVESDKVTFIEYAQNKIKDLFASTLIERQSNGQKLIDSSDTWIIPLVQAGKLNIHMDSLTTSRILSSASSSSMIRLATGYFNLTSDYMEALAKNCQAYCSLLMAHPNANGFLGAKGAAGGVPDAYSLLARKFSEYVEELGQSHRFSLFEYEKPGWTYHGKGLWYYPCKQSLPTMTLIGSPNFGERSVNRDIESQIVLLTTNPDLKKRLHDECETLHIYSRDSNKELFNRKIPLWVKMTVGLFRNFF